MTDSDSGAVSQEEIAHQFVIPERKVKVEQLLRKMSSPEDDEEIYCICRSSDCSTFMIGCDRCNEWYHGACINLTQEESNHIKHFYCHICRGKDPLLKIKYKHKKRDKEREREKARQKEHKHRVDKHHSSSDKHRHHDKYKKHDKHKEKIKDRSHAEKIKEKSHGEKMREKSLVEKAREKMLQEAMKESLREKITDTGPVIKKEQVKEPPKEISKEPTKDILKEPVKEVTKEPVVSAVTPPKPQLSPLPSNIDRSPSTHKMTSRSTAAVKKSVRRCGECISCHRTEDCGRCDYCKDMKKFGGPNKIRQKCRLRQCLNFGTKMKVTKVKEMTSDGLERDDTDPDYMYSSPARSTAKSAYSDSDFSTPGRKRGRKAEKKQKEVKKSPGRARSKRKAEEEMEDIMIHVEDEQIPRQCLGPGCIEPAREGSKYCSDECGMKLATNRIFEIMPQRIQQWQATPCIAEENNKHALETIRNAQLEARRKLVQLDMKHKEVDVLIDRAKNAVVSKEQEITDGEEESEMSIHCPTCGHEIAQKSALKHMERCFNRFESQTSYGSIYKTRVDLGTMFCDYYNTQAKTYCKRLKVLCPEHSKEPKMSPDEVCGCPLVTNIFQNTGEFCLARKRLCNKHYCWEKLRRAEIDMEKVRQWMKLDDLFEKERHIRMAMSCRAGVLGLVLHQTIDHNPMRPIKTVKSAS